MRPECINEVARAIGRRVTAAEAQQIEDRIINTQRRLASRDPTAWRSMSQAERVRAAAASIGKDIEEAAALKERRAALAVHATARHLPDIEAAGKRGFKKLALKLSQVDAYIKGTARDAYRQILDTMDFATKSDGNPIRWICNLENPEHTLDFVREVFGKDSGSAEAKAAAKAWVDGVEGLRQRFNAAGGEIRKLVYSYLPQPHDAARVRGAGIEKWVREARSLVDRSRYFDEFGRPLNDQDMTTVLETMWRTIQSDGVDNIVPGEARGISAIAARYAESRELHFAGPDEYVQYLDAYGHGTVFNAMQSHVSRLSRDIGLVENFGPNPEQVFRTLHDQARKSGASDTIAIATSTSNMWKTLTGELANAQSQTMAAIGQGLRNIEVIGKLQGTPVTAITDIATYYQTLGYNRLSAWQGTVNLVRAFGSDARRFSDLGGLIADSLVSDMNRWSEGMLGRGWTTRIAAGTMKVSLINYWTDAIRRGYGMTMMHGLAELSKTGWDQLGKHDRARLSEQGWTADEWATIQQATHETWRQTPMLTPAAVYAIEGVDLAAKQRAVSRLLGTIVDESEFASLAPDLTTRSIGAGGLQKGTGLGELWRCEMLFKSFPIAMITRHWDRMLHSDSLTPAGRVAYGATLFSSLTLLGGIAIAMNDILRGQDPRDMFSDDPAKSSKFWLAAFLKGGGAGFVGDLMLSGVGRQGQSGASTAASAIAGPVIGSGFEALYDIGFRNIRDAASDQEHPNRDAELRWVRGHLPLINLWYAKAALDHAFLNDLQEMISPGYLDRMRARAQKDDQSDWWWNPESATPTRAPNIATAVGQQ